MAIQEAAVIFQYKLDKLVQVFENDKDLEKLLIENNLYIGSSDIPNPDRTALYESILTTLIRDSEEISNTSITDLLSVYQLRADVNSSFSGAPALNDEMYRQILFSFKYGTIKSFFRKNYSYFMPNYDYSVINNNAKLKIWQEAFMREFDRFAQIIDDIKDVNDIDSISEDYLDYIAQLVGYERGDTNINDSLFREITKNIIEVYRIKGTNFSFELFFNFIGFEIEIIEYWFDRRFYLSDISINPYTKETSKNKFAFYLTPNKPTESFPKAMNSPFAVMDNELTDIRNGLWFDKKLENATETEIKEYLGLVEADPPLDETYTYFKTNVVEYSISKITDSNIPEGLTKEDETTIQSYTNFLTPIFVSKKLVINITPFEDDGSSVLLFKDTDYNGESMFVSQLLGDLLLKVGLGSDITNFQELELWGLDYLDHILTSYVQELNVWKGGHDEWDDLKSMHEDPLYNNTNETLSGFNIYYPYINNKPITTDYKLESSNGNLMIEEDVFNDYIYMTSKSMHYSGYGIGITFAKDVDIKVGLISSVIPGIIISSDGADTRISLYTSFNGTVNTSGAAITKLSDHYLTSGTATTSGIAITKLSDRYLTSGTATTSGAAIIKLSDHYSTSGTATTSGIAIMKLSDHYSTSGTATTSGAATTHHT